MPTPARIRATIASIVIQPDDLRELRAFHKALADVNRLRIVRRLAHGEATVAELIAHVGLSQPLVVMAPRAPPRRRARRDPAAAAARRSAACAPEAFAEFAARERAHPGRRRADAPTMTDLQRVPRPRSRSVFEPIALGAGPARPDAERA